VTIESDEVKNSVAEIDTNRSDGSSVHAMILLGPKIIPLQG